MCQYTRIGRFAGVDPPLRALLSWCVFVIALALATVGSAIADTATGQLPAVIRSAVPAIITLLVTVPLVLLIHRRRRGLLALKRPRRVFTGIAVVGSCAAVAFIPAVLAGWITVTDVDLPVLLVFLVTNTLLALALEALPEELIFRGSIYGSTRSLCPRWLAAITTTGAFVVAPAASIALAAVLGPALGLHTASATFAPGGQNPIDYAVLLTVFSFCLILAREAVDSIWASVGTHLTFLTVNRLSFPGKSNTGMTTAVEPGTELLVLGYLLTACAVFVLIRRTRTRRSQTPQEARQRGQSSVEASRRDAHL